MLQYPINVNRYRARFRYSRRFQLGGGLAVAVLFPWLLRISFDPTLLDVAVVRDSMLASMFAVLFGFYVYRSLTIYPGIRASYYILPSFSMAYGVILLFFLMARMDYSRFILASGYILSLTWYFGLFFMAQRGRSMRVGIVPFGAVQLKDVKQVEWVPLRTPIDPSPLTYDALVADFRADLPDEWERFLADSALAGTTVYHVKDLRESLTGRVHIDHLSENSFGSLIPARAYFKIKEAIDFVTALVTGLILLPALLVAAAFVRFDSPGPILFRQLRVGYGGAPFNVYKFRTMIHRKDEDADDLRRAITNDDDPRITKVGRVLRRYRIDELPQLLNILRGEMSWIGPRPEAEVLSKWYERELPFYRYRHIVKPGITGWAQVNQGHVAEVTDVLWKLQYDFFYIKNFSPWLDGLIMFRTLKTLLTGFGSR